MSRELTRDERRVTRTLVTGWCANYDSECGCLPLDCPCYMLNKCCTGALCRYFREAVLPMNPMLEKAVTEEGPVSYTRLCILCGRPFLPKGRQAYCSEACKAEGNRLKSRERVRKMRKKNRDRCYD